jgi:integrase
MTHHFKFEGRRYTLYKRDDFTGAPKHAPWYLRASLNGKRLRRSLDTNIAAAAAARAVAEFIRPAKAGRWTHKKLRGGWPRVGSVLDVYSHLAAGLVGERTARDNRNALARMFAIVRGVEVRRGEFETWIERVRGECVSALDGKFNRAFAAAWRAARGDGLEGDARARALASAERGGAAYLRCARSIFAEELLPHYADRGLQFPPQLEEWRKGRVFSPEPVPYAPVGDAVVKATVEAIEELRGAPDVESRNLYVAFWLIMGTGLRKGEATRVRWEHVINQDTPRGPQWAVVMEALGKDGQALFAPVEPTAWSRLEGLRRAEGWVFEGTQSERRQLVWRRLGRWMTEHGWTTRMKAHELRAWFISKVVERFGLDVGAALARHKDKRLTDQKYGRYVKLPGVVLDFPGIEQ